MNYLKTLIKPNPIEVKPIKTKKVTQNLHKHKEELLNTKF